MAQQNIGICKNEIDVYACSIIAPEKAQKICTIERQSILNIIYEISAGRAIIARQCDVYIGGHFIPRDKWESVTPKKDVTIQITPMGGGGGKSPLASVLSIVSLLAAPQLSVALAGAFGVSATASIGIAGITYGQLFSGVIGIASKLLISAIAPPPKPKLNSLSPNNQQSSPTYFIQGAKNDLRQFGVVPVVIGTHRMVPPQAARPFTSQVASNTSQSARQLFTWGYGESIDVTDIRIGDTSIDNFNGVSTENVFDGDSSGTLETFPQSVDQVDYNVTLNEADGYTIRTTSANTDEIEFDVTFPNGLAFFNKKGNINSQTVEFEYGYSVTGAGSFTSTSFQVTASQTSAVRVFKSITVPRGQYDIRIKRVTADTDSTQILDTAVLTAIRSFTNENPINIDGINLTSLKITATDQLNGVVDQYNGIVSHHIPDYDSTSGTWITRATSNPASWFRYILQGAANENPITDAKLDITRLQEWHDYCVERGFECNGVIDYETTVMQVLADIAASGRAQPTIRDGKYSVVIDKVKTDIVQHVTPRNSNNYSVEITYPTIPHAFRVQFLNEEKGYLQDERVVYDDGYNASNATKFERLELPFITRADLAYIHGREFLAMARLRRLTHVFDMDVENLIFERGDLIRLTNDVILQGLGAARVKDLTDNGTHVTSIDVDDVFTMQTGKSYAVRIRLSDGTSSYHAIDTDDGDNTTVTFTTPILLADAPEIGDLVMFGESGTESRELIVQEIDYRGDLAASIKCLDYAPEIFEAATGAIPNFVSNVTLPVEFSRPNAPELVSVQSDESVQIVNIDGSITNRMVINLRNNNAGVVEPIVKIKQVDDTEYQRAQTTQLDPERVIIENLAIGAVYDIEIVYRRVAQSNSLINNIYSDSLTLNGQTFFGAGNPPSDVENFDITVRSDSVFLSWDRVTDIDLDGYEIRFNNNITGATWENSLPLATNIGKDQATFAAVSAIGTYLIKARDLLGILSENETTVVTNIGALEGLNVVLTINESATWPGTFSGTVNDAGSLKLGASDTIDDWTLIDDIANWDLGESGIGSAGTYTFGSTADLGSVYTSVIRTEITISGLSLNDLIDEWVDIDSRQNWDGTEVSEYSVRLQVRTTNDDPAGTPTWSEWKDFVIGEYTARAFQFRILLEALVSDITPVVSSLTVVIDMPDRVVSEDDITTDAAGQSITYPNGSFRAVPAIAIAEDDRATGDYYAITNKTASGFDIRFFNSSGTGISRTFSYVAKGYGRIVA